MKRRIMKDFTITEISGVDRPAQTHARVAIMKRDSEERTMTKYATFGEAVEDLRKRLKLTGTQAMQRAADSFPELLEKHRAARPAPEPVAKEGGDAIRKFRSLVDEIETRDGCSRMAALQKAQRTHPAEFAAYQAA